MRAHIIICMLPLFPLFAQQQRTPAGAFIERTYISNTQYRLTWGNVMFRRTLPDKFTVGFYDNPKFVWENPEYICLQAECEVGCWYAILLPMDENADYVFFTRPLAYDTINNYVAFPGDGDTLVTIEHITSGASRFLVTWDRCGNEENYTCIQNVSFDPVRLEVSISWLACGSESHPEVYSTERKTVISLHP
jgi:hypothetical protein